MRRGLLLLALPLALVACGGSQKGARPPLHLTPAAYVKHAAHKTAQAPSEHMTLKATTSSSGLNVSMNGSGDFSNTRHEGSMNLTANTMGMPITISEILHGATIYMSSPLFAGSLPGGKKWFRLDLEKVGKAQGIDFSALMGQSPAQSLAQLQAAGTVRRVGTETVDGVQATHYRVHVDISKLPQAAKIPALTHAKYGPVDLWIGNSDGYVVRMAEQYSYSTHGQSARMSMTSDFSKFGEHVNVTVPPASETVDMTGQALKGLGG
jgi:hypothetical protein